MNYKLSKYEMETTINWNEKEATATCFTCSKALQRRLDGFCSKSQLIYRVELGDGGVKYTFPKKWVRVVLSCILTDEEREKRALRMKEAQEKQKRERTSE